VKYEEGGKEAHRISTHTLNWTSELCNNVVRNHGLRVFFFDPVFFFKLW
jgi:hypothetical protein